MARSVANNITFLRCKNCLFSWQPVRSAHKLRQTSVVVCWLTFRLIGNVLYRKAFLAPIKFVESWVQFPRAKQSGVVLRSGRMVAIVRHQRHKKENDIDSTTIKNSSGIPSGGSTLVFCSHTAGAGRRRQSEVPARS